MICCSTVAKRLLKCSKSAHIPLVSVSAAFDTHELFIFVLWGEVLVFRRKVQDKCNDILQFLILPRCYDFWFQKFIFISSSKTQRSCAVSLVYASLSSEILSSKTWRWKWWQRCGTRNLCRRKSWALIAHFFSSFSQISLALIVSAAVQEFVSVFISHL